MSFITQQKLGIKVRKLRIQGGFSQEDLARHLGLSRQAIGQIEAGERKVDGTELARLSEILSVSIDSLLRSDTGSFKISKRFLGKLAMKPDVQKLKNLLLYILAQCGGKPNVGETVLYKLLYFIDFDAFELLGKSVTGMAYMKLQYGPVPLPSTYLGLIRQMTEKRDLEIIKQTYHGMIQKKYVALADADASIFSGPELRVIDGVIERLSEMTATKITEYVHEDVPWKEAEPEHIIDYRLVFERTAPYARMDREVVWQEAAGTDSSKGIGKMSQKEIEYYEKL